MVNSKVKHGRLKVHYISHMGTDMSPVNAARISRNANELKKRRVNAKDRKLMNFLAKNKHMTPFEHQTLTVLIECPLYIRSQIHRHRTFSMNEISRRYTSDGIKFYFPRFHLQGLKDKQKSSSRLLDAKRRAGIIRRYENLCAATEKFYNEMIDLGVSREDARSILPTSLMTKFYMTGNLRNWAHFLELRMDDHAQWESRVIARNVLKIAKKKFPVTMEVLMKYTDMQNSTELNRVLSTQ